VHVLEQTYDEMKANLNKEEDENHFGGRNVN